MKQSLLVVLAPPGAGSMSGAQTLAAADAAHRLVALANADARYLGLPRC